MGVFPWGLFSVGVYFLSKVEWGFFSLGVYFLDPCQGALLSHKYKLGDSDWVTEKIWHLFEM